MDAAAVQNHSQPAQTIHCPNVIQRLDRIATELRQFHDFTKSMERNDNMVKKGKMIATPGRLKVANFSTSLPVTTQAYGCKREDCLGNAAGKRGADSLLNMKVRTVTKSGLSANKNFKSCSEYRKNVQMPMLDAVKTDEYQQLYNQLSFSKLHNEERGSLIMQS